MNWWQLSVVRNQLFHGSYVVNCESQIKPVTTKTHAHNRNRFRLVCLCFHGSILCLPKFC